MDPVDEGGGDGGEGGGHGEDAEEGREADPGPHQDEGQDGVLGQEEVPAGGRDLHRVALLQHLAQRIFAKQVGQLPPETFFLKIHK